MDKVVNDIKSNDVKAAVEDVAIIVEKKVETVVDGRQFTWNCGSWVWSLKIARKTTASAPPTSPVVDSTLPTPSAPKTV